MSHEEEHKAMSTDEKLVYMANQIATFFASQPRDRAVGVANHINDFWEPRMRRRFFEIAAQKDNGLSPLVVDALPHIRKPPPPDEGHGRPPP